MGERRKSSLSFFLWKENQKVCKSRYFFFFSVISPLSFFRCTFFFRFSSIASDISAVKIATVSALCSPFEMKLSAILVMFIVFSSVFWEHSLAQNTKQALKWNNVLTEGKPISFVPFGEKREATPEPWETTQDIYDRMTEQDKALCASICPPLGDITDILICSVEIFDQNKDALIEKEETESAKYQYLSFFERPFAPVTKWLFMLDSNADGVVDLSEMRENGPLVLTCNDFYMINKFFCGRRK